jgi:hypothetical protein
MLRASKRVAEADGESDSLGLGSKRACVAAEPSQPPEAEAVPEKNAAQPASRVAPLSKADPQEGHGLEEEDDAFEEERFECVLCRRSLEELDFAGRVAHMKRCSASQSGSVLRGFVARAKPINRASRPRAGTLLSFFEQPVERARGEQERRAQEAWSSTVERWHSILDGKGQNQLTQWQKRQGSSQRSQPRSLSADAQGLSASQSRPPCPRHKRVEGTGFIVDGFAHDPGGARAFFLSHFHSDHYTGLSRAFRAGTIFCSRATASLAQLSLGVPAERFQVLPLNKRVTVDGVGVTLVDANHCPGAVMFIFDLPVSSEGTPPPDRSRNAFSALQGARASSPSPMQQGPAPCAAAPCGAPPVTVADELSQRRIIVHTGDFRFHPLMLEVEALRRVQGRVHVLHLDTTYCDPNRDFPPQAEMIDYCVRVVAEALGGAGSLGSQQTLTGRVRALVAVGTYSIGKERILLQLAEQIGVKVAVSGAHFARLACMSLPLPSGRRLDDVFTTDWASAPVHVLPLSEIKPSSLGEHLRRHGRGTFNAIVGIAPTGWSGDAPRMETHGNVTVHHVPYSEHSSLRELREFVRFLRPRTLVPTVGGRSSDAALQMLGHFTDLLRP